MSWGLRIRLSAMMFLAFAIRGAWAPVLYPHLKALGFSSFQTTWIFSALWLACMVAPFLGGQVVDRWFPTQWFLAAVHLVGGVLLLGMTQQRGFAGLMALMQVYALLYAPTVALTASLCFHHLRDPDKDFGPIRVFGTFGWIAAGVVLSGWRYLAGRPVPADMFWLAGICSLAMGVLCLFLPHTPPRKVAGKPWAFLEALRLLKRPQFLTFMVISFVVTTELQFYYVPTAGFLQDGVGVAERNVPAVMTIAQIAELICMGFFLSVSLKRLGIRKTLAIGVLAWPVRYVAFALFQVLPWQVVVASLALHGLGYTFFFVVSQIYVDRVAPPDIRGSAQALLTFVTLGLGNFLGTHFYGLIEQLLSHRVTREVVVQGVARTQQVTVCQWQWIFLVPCLLTVACAAAFLLLFREPPQGERPAGP